MASQIRIEPSTNNSDLQDGLQARIHDPLWMLARQWQFGEFKGEDAGSPASAQVLADITSLNRYRGGPPSGTQAARPYAPSALPLETLVEGEPVDAERTPNWKRSAETGLYLFRLLNAVGAGPSRSVWLSSAYVLVPPSAEQRRRLDHESI